MSAHELTGGGLRASPGDRLVIRGHHLGARERDGEILEVLGEDGLPPFLVRWSDDGHVSRLRPGSDAYVEHYYHALGQNPLREGALWAGWAILAAATVVFVAAGVIGLERRDARQ